MLVEKASRLVAQVNPAAAAMIGLPQDRIVGQRCHGFMCPAESNSCPVCDLGQTVDRSERILIRASGERVPILKTVVPLNLGGKDFLLESFIDVAEKNRAGLHAAQAANRFGKFLLAVARDTGDPKNFSRSYSQRNPPQREGAHIAGNHQVLHF